MPKIPGVNHLDAVRALEKAGFRILRQGKHIVMSDGIRIVTIPRNNPVNAFTMGGIARDAGLSVEQFKTTSLMSTHESLILSWLIPGRVWIRFEPTLRLAAVPVR